MNVHSVWTAGIRDKLIAAGLAGGNVERDRSMPTRRDGLPMCLIAVVDDKAVADTDPRAGIPRFRHECELVIEHRDEADSGPALRQKLYAAGQLILGAVLSDLSWSGTIDGVDPLEGVSRVDVAYDLPPDGESEMGRVVVTLRLLHATAWAPATAGLDNFATTSIGVDTGGEAPEIGATIPVPTA
jgi:hypothetical protein